MTMDITHIKMIVKVQDLSKDIIFQFDKLGPFQD